MTEKRKAAAVPLTGFALIPVNLILTAPVEARIVTHTTIQPQFVGAPIMREGFITGTGLLPPSFLPF